MRRVGYLNLKIISGVSLKGGDSVALPTQVGREFNRMVEHCSWSACTLGATMRRWDRTHCRWFSPNWFLPVHLGGYGVDPRHRPTNFRVTRGQRLIAARFHADPSLSLYFMGSVSYTALSLLDKFSKARWVSGDYVLNQHEEYAISSEWLGRFMYGARLAKRQDVQNARDERDVQNARSEGKKPPINLRHFSPDYRLKPMSQKRIVELWTGQYVRGVLPPTGPLWPLIPTTLNPVPGFDYTATFPFRQDLSLPQGDEKVGGMGRSKDSSEIRLEHSQKPIVRVCRPGLLQLEHNLVEKCLDLSLRGKLNKLPCEVQDQILAFVG